MDHRIGVAQGGRCRTYEFLQLLAGDTQGFWSIPLASALPAYFRGYCDEVGSVSAGLWLAAR